MPPTNVTPAATAPVATSDLKTCTASELSDYTAATQACDASDKAATCTSATRAFFTAHAQIDCVSGANGAADVVELRASGTDSGLAELLNSPIAANSSIGLCGSQVETDFTALVSASCNDSSMASGHLTAACEKGVRDFLNRYPDVDCHPEAARTGQPLRSWRLKALVDL